MEPILEHAGAVPVVHPSHQPIGVGKRLLKLLYAIAYATADRITLPQRDLSPEFYRFPPL